MQAGWTVGNQPPAAVPAPRLDDSRYGPYNPTSTVTMVPEISPLRLNVGAGAKRLEGWVSLDLRRDVSDIVSDARSLPFADGVAEELLASDVLEHFPLSESYGLLTEWHRVLRPGGLLTVRVPNLLALSQLIVAGHVDRAVVNIYGGHRFGPGGSWDSHHTGWTPQGLESLLQHAGFQLQSNDGEPNMTVKATTVSATPTIIRKGQKRSLSLCVLAGEDLTSLFRCITSLASSPPCEEFEVVVVDRGDNPGISALFDSLEGDIVVVKQPGVSGQAQMANAAFEASSGEVVVLLSDEIEATPGWARSLLSAFEHDCALGMAVPAVMNSMVPSGWSPGCLVAASPLDEMLMTAPLDGEAWVATRAMATNHIVAPDGALAVRRGCLDSAGGVDGGFFRTMHWPALVAAMRDRGWRTVNVNRPGLRLHRRPLTTEDVLASYLDRARFTQLWGERLAEGVDAPVYLVGGDGEPAGGPRRNGLKLEWTPTGFCVTAAQ